MLQRSSFVMPVIRWVLVMGMVLPMLVPLRMNPGSTVLATGEHSLVAKALAGEVSLDAAAVRSELAALAPQLSQAERRSLLDRYYQQIIANETDLEAFARLADLAAVLSTGDADTFMLQLSGITLDATSNWQAPAAGAWGRLKHRLHNRWPSLPGYPALARFGCTGFAAADGGNQVQHVWYSVAITYRYGRTIADLEARYHEWNAPGILSHLPGTGQGAGSELDLALSRQGMQLGRALAQGTIKPSEVGGWLRTNLGAAAVAEK